MNRKCWLMLGFVLIGLGLSAQNKALYSTASFNRGKDLYLVQCLACHQMDGGGVPHLNAPLDGSTNVKGKDKALLIRTVLNGLKGVELDGETYSNVMAPHKELKDQEIADILTYVRNAWTNHAGPVLPAEVKSVRAKLK